VVVVVLDSTRPLSQFDASFTEGRLTITVLNKRDLVPLSVPGIISVSAGRNENIAAVVMAICKKLGVDDFDLSSPVCFTSRQHDIMQKLACAVDAAVACGLITELINGPADV
ncbi:MAG TPA: hypothetical protein VLH60_01130, partial [Sedimentisphaerales bacterium]|nr:hypothetical protein [Sedimentisphaerales bacterium]